MKDNSQYSPQINFYPVRNDGVGLSNGVYWLYLAGFFLILAQIINVLPPWSIPIDWGKAIVFRITLAILIFLFLLQILFRKINISDIKEKIKSVSLPFWLLISLFAIYLLATIFSLDPWFSLWGDPRRNGGFVNFAFYIIFAILAFLIIRKKDWQKILDFAIVIGIVVSIIAIFQQFGIFSKYLIPYTIRPISTLGNAIVLSLYLLLLTFISLSLGIKAENRFKKAFYFFSSLLFLLISVLLVQTRGAFIGLAIGFLWFLFTYPKKFTKLKISAAIVLVFVLLGMYWAKLYLDANLEVYQKMPPIISSTVDRVLSIFEGPKISESRMSAWKVSLSTLKERLILGYGPENFSIAFDKHYDPSLPLIGPGSPGDVITEWWDRAHNFILEISITAGIPALLIYLLLFATLIWQLQRLKRDTNSLIAHGLQATFVGYLAALFTTFDSVSTYLIAFLLIGYSLHLISGYYPNPAPEQVQYGAGLRIKSQSTNKKPAVISQKLYKARVPIIVILFIFLIFFIQAYNLRPLWLNKEINISTHLSEIKKCDLALQIFNKISPQIGRSIIDAYLNRKLTGIIYNCTRGEEIKDENLVKQAIQIMREVTDSHPHHLENWFLSGQYINILIEDRNKLTDGVFVPTEEMKKLKDEANYSFEKAQALSPQRQMILREWAKTDIITEDYEMAKQKLQKCLDLNPNSTACIWLMALAQGYSENWQEFNHFFRLAVEERRFDAESEQSLKQLADMYIRVRDYHSLSEIYLKLIEITEDKQKKAQIQASLAAVYLELGQIEKARQEALKILELIPFFPSELQAGAKADVEMFLQLLSE